MPAVTKERFGNWAMGAFVIVLAACIPIGLFMGFYMNDARWWLLCAPLLIFMS